MLYKKVFFCDDHRETRVSGQLIGTRSQEVRSQLYTLSREEFDCHKLRQGKFSFLSSTMEDLDCFRANYGEALHPGQLALVSMSWKHKRIKPWATNTQALANQYLKYIYREFIHCC